MSSWDFCGRVTSSTNRFNDVVVFADVDGLAVRFCGVVDLSHRDVEATAALDLWLGVDDPHSVVTAMGQIADDVVGSLWRCDDGMQLETLSCISCENDSESQESAYISFMISNSDSGRFGVETASCGVSMLIWFGVS